MADRRNTILDYLVNTLLPSITVANGYNLTMDLVTRDATSLLNIDQSQCPAAVVDAVNEEQTAGMGVLQISTSAYVPMVLPIGIAVVVIPGNSNDVGTDSDKAGMDVLKALRADPTLGGNVLFLDEAKSGFDALEGGERGIVLVTFTAHYTAAL